MTIAGSDEPPARRADQRRNDELILQTAARLLAMDPGVSLQAIADAAGLTRPTVYRRYPTREALAAGIRAAASADMMRALDATGAVTGPDALRSLLRSLVTLGRRYPIVFSRHHIEPAGQRAPVDERMVEILAAGQHAGVLRADLDADLLNAAIFGVLSTVVPRYPARDADVLADDLAGLLLDGLTGASAERH